MEIVDRDIGGARVRRAFSRNGERLKPGALLSREDVIAMPMANRRAMVSTGMLELFPRAVESISVGQGTEVHIVHTGRGNHDVIRGVKLNSEPLTREAAEELATRPVS